MISDYVILGVRNIRNRQLRSWLTMIGIFIGVAAVISLISLGQGLQAAINEEFSTFGIDKVFIEGKGPDYGPPGSFAAGKVTEDDVDLIKKVSGVENAAGRVIKIANIEFDNELQARAVVSLPEDQKEASLIIASNNYEVKQGRMLKGSDRERVVVGYDFQYGKVFDKHVGVGNKLLINGREFEVVGVLDKLGDPFRDVAVMITEDSMRNLFETNKELNVIVAQVKKGEDLDKVAEDIKKRMRKDRNQEEGKDDFEIQTPQQYLESFNIIIKIVQAVVVGIAAISLLVGSIGIMNTMYTAVMERTKEIGVMKATGARNSQILAIFLLESGILGLAGGIVGVVIGMALGKGVELIANQAMGSELLRAYFQWQLILGALLFSFALGAVSGVLPALQASKLKPADALRYE